MINELESNLKHLLGWNKSTANCLTQLLLALVTLRTVNLKLLACAMTGDAQLDSNYRRLQRFFAKVKFQQHTLARMVVGFFLHLIKYFIFRLIVPIGSGEVHH